MLRVLGEVEVGSVGDAFEFSESWCGEREAVFDVRGSRAFFGVVGELIVVVLAEDEVVSFESEVLPPLHAPVAPEGVPRFGVFRMAEELDLHLLELA